MDPHTREGLDLLNARLPLAARQQALPPTDRALHRAILFGLGTHGRPPAHAELEALAGEQPLDAVLQRLNDADLVVTSEDGMSVLGAYPLTTEQTRHRVTVGGHTVHAMCALDAVAVAPLFRAATEITSRCHVTDREIRLAMQSDRLLTAEPSTVRIGIEWSTPQGHAAHSLCLNMVFLADLPTAEAWVQACDRTHYDLAQAITFGAHFFCPLLD